MYHSLVSASPAEHYSCKIYMIVFLNWRFMNKARTQSPQLLHPNATVPSPCWMACHFLHMLGSPWSHVTKRHLWLPSSSPTETATKEWCASLHFDSRHQTFINIIIVKKPARSGFLCLVIYCFICKCFLSVYNKVFSLRLVSWRFLNELTWLHGKINLMGKVKVEVVFMFRLTQQCCLLGYSRVGFD